MAEALGRVVKGYVVVAAGQDGIEKQRVNMSSTKVSGGT